MHFLRSLFLFVLLLPNLACFSQQRLVDSLVETLKVQPLDTNRVQMLIEISDQLRGIEPNEAIKFGEQARDLALQLHYSKGLAMAYKYIGLGYSVQNQYLEATLNWQEAQRIFQEIGDQDGVANILSNLGTLYSTQDDDEKALELYLQALEIAEASDNKMRILTVSLNIGLIYQKKESTRSKALDYYFVTLRLSEELNYPIGIGYASVNMGEIFFAQEDDSTALIYFEKSREALQNTDALPYSMINIAKVYLKRGDYLHAKEVLESAYSIANETNSKLYMAQALMGMASVYVGQNIPERAIQVLREAELLAIEAGSKESLKEVYEGLAEYSSKSNDYKSAFDYQRKLTAVNDSLFRTANEKTLNLMMTNFNLEKKEREVEVQELTIQKQRLVKNLFFIGLMAILLIAFIIFRNYLAKVKVNRLLDKQNEEIEGLLRNILPEKVALELQKEGHATPHDYESVTVLFTDFVGFSTIAKGLKPNELVSELSSFFVAFDSIIGAHNLEKIKTIGDAYMCAGGIPTENDTHPLDTVKAGLEMQQFMAENNRKRIAEGKEPWQLRVGIHTGPIVAGVVGKKKYAYDIWGSTVNIASRMESNGEAGKVNISETTYNLIKQVYSCSPRGKIYAKNVGEIDMYFVENTEPNYEK